MGQAAESRQPIKTVKQSEKPMAYLFNLSA